MGNAPSSIQLMGAASTKQLFIKLAMPMKKQPIGIYNNLN